MVYIFLLTYILKNRNLGENPANKYGHPYTIGKTQYRYSLFTLIRILLAVLYFNKKENAVMTVITKSI